MPIVLLPLAVFFHLGSHDRDRAGQTDVTKLYRHGRRPKTLATSPDDLA